MRECGVTRCIDNWRRKMSKPRTCRSSRQNTTDAIFALHLIPFMHTSLRTCVSLSCRSLRRSIRKCDSFFDGSRCPSSHSPAVELCHCRATETNVPCHRRRLRWRHQHVSISGFPLSPGLLSEGLTGENILFRYKSFRYRGKYFESVHKKKNLTVHKVD